MQRQVRNPPSRFPLAKLNIEQQVLGIDIHNMNTQHSRYFCTAGAGGARARPNPELLPATGPFAPGTAARRAAFARTLGPRALKALLRKVVAAHAELVGRYPVQQSIVLPGSSGNSSSGSGGSSSGGGGGGGTGGSSSSGYNDGSRGHSGGGSGSSTGGGSSSGISSSGCGGANEAGAGAGYSSGVWDAELQERLRRQQAQLDPLLVFDPKHAMQQASIVGQWRCTAVLCTACLQSAHWSLRTMLKGHQLIHKPPVTPCVLS